MAHFSISQTAKTYPSLPYEEIKNAILGKTYQLSLVFIGTERARSLNQTLRNKDYTPDVLSLPLAESVGEIYICPVVARAAAATYEHTPDGHIGFLFIHGLLHLKGYEHGDTMEKAERRYCKKFSIA